MYKIFSTGMYAGSRLRLITLMGCTLTIAAGSIQFILFLGLLQHSVYGTTEGNATNELTQTYENETANIRIHYPTNWFSETRNIEYPQTVRFFPTEFMAERYPPVVLGISIFNASNSPIFLNLTQVADIFERPYRMSDDVRIINSTVNATLFNGTVPAFQINHFDFSRPYMDTEEMIIGTFLNNTKIGYVLQYYTEPEYFDKYLPEAQKIIDSFQLLSNTTK